LTGGFAPPFETGFSLVLEASGLANIGVVKSSSLEQSYRRPACSLSSYKFVVIPRTMCPVNGLQIGPLSVQNTIEEGLSYPGSGVIVPSKIKN